VAVFALAITLIAYGIRGAKPPSSWFAKEGVDEFPAVREVWSYGGGDVKAVRIPVVGAIVREAPGGFFGPGLDPVESVLRMVRAATNDESVQAILLEIDSPGGGVTASDEIHRALLVFRASAPNRRVVALFGDIAASGGYYIATAADHIVAHPTTITGSIGVLISTINLKDFGEKTGIKGVTIKSGVHKDLLNPFEHLDAAQRAILQGVIDDMQDRFVGLVAEGRNLAPEQVRELADGRIFSAREALDAQLIDEIGYWDDAVATACRLVGVESLKIFRYEEGGSIWSLLRATGNVRFSLSQLLHAPPRALYLWQP
jgi:protease IV